MRVLDLFSGIGGFSLGLERAGMTTVAFAEIDPYCSQVLKKHWPHVKNYGDVRSLSAQHLTADRIAVDVICGGFPCQDISNAGNREGIYGERSGLWSEYARIIGEVRPQYVIVENVAALLGRGLSVVLGDLAALGFDAEWHCIPASAVGAPHRRDRVWIVAHARCLCSVWRGCECRGQETAGTCDRSARSGQHAVDVADAASSRPDGYSFGEAKKHTLLGKPSEDVGDASGSRLAIGLGTLGQWAHAATTGTGWWAIEPDVGRVANGVPARVDRLRALGNAVIPQIPEVIGRAILAAERGCVE